jgi:hypothetical protein
MTDQQERAVDLRNLARMTFREIGQALGMSPQAAHQHYVAGMRYMTEAGLSESAESGQHSRLEKREFIDNRLKMYDEIAQAHITSHPRTAIEALNGAYKYLELLVRLEGIEAPVRHQISVTTSLIETEIQTLEAKIGADGSYDVNP